MTASRLGRFYPAAALALCLTGPLRAFGADKRFQRACPVYSSPSLESKVVCEKKAGVPVRAIRGIAGDFISVETPACNGYISNACLGLPEEGAGSSAEGTGGKEKTAPPRSPPLSPRTTLGLMVGGNGSFGHPPSGDSTSGFAYAVQLRLTFPLGDRFRLSAAPGYEVLSLTRTIDGTGTLPPSGSTSGGAGLIDPDPAQFTQQIRYLALGGYVGFRPLGQGGGSRTGDLEWWVEAGFDLLYPVSAVQSDNFNDQQSFTSHDKVFFTVAGVSGEMPVTSVLVAGAAIQGAYNLGASAGNQLLSARFSLFLQMRL